MVWGMPLPPGPYGEFEGKVDDYGDGWRHRLIRYYLEEMPKTQKEYFRDPSNYAYCVSEKFLYQPGHKQPGPADIVVTPIETHEPPRFFQFSSGHKAPASIISLPNRILAVSQSFKAFIEWLEPGVHQFFPIEIKNTRGRVYVEDYYVLAIGQRLDCFVPDKSAKHTFRTGGYYSLTGGSKKEVTGLALSRTMIGGAHMWHERAFREWLICFSDELIAEVSDAGLKMPKHWQMKEV